MRKCKYQIWIKHEMKYSNPCDGVFHGWGYDIIEYTDGFVQFSIALVESVDGFVHKIDPDKIIFTDTEIPSAKNIYPSAPSAVKGE